MEVAPPPLRQPELVPRDLPASRLNTTSTSHNQNKGTKGQGNPELREEDNVEEVPQPQQKLVPRKRQNSRTG